MIRIASSDRIRLGPIRHVNSERDPASNNSDSTTASTSSVRAPVLQKFTFLAAKMTNTHVATRRVHRLKSSWTNTWRSSSHMEEPMAAILDGSSGYVPQSCATGVDSLSAPASEAYVERIFSLCRMLTAGRRNQLKKNLEMRVFLKLKNNILSWMLTVL